MLLYSTLSPDTTRFSPPSMRRLLLPSAAWAAVAWAVWGAAAMLGCAEGQEPGLVISSTVPNLDPDADYCGFRCTIGPQLTPNAVNTLRDYAEDTAGSSEASGSGAPNIVYPLDGSLHPANIFDITFQFLRQNTEQRYFLLRVATVDEGPEIEFEFFTRCLNADGITESNNRQCVYPVPAAKWFELDQEAKGRQLEARLYARTYEGELEHSRALTLQLSDEAVEGGFYYWSTSLRGTYRLVFGARKATPWIQPNSERNDTDCGGCHAVSRSGEVIAFTAQEASGTLHVADAANPSQKSIAGEPSTSMQTLNADGTLVLSAHNGELTLRDVASGDSLATLPELPNGERAYFPEFSPDGSEIVVSLSQNPESFWAVLSGSIAVLPLEESGGSYSFGEPEVIVPMSDDLHHFYPSWSPNGRWIIFASAPLARSSYDQSDSQLRLVERDSGVVYELSRATQGVGFTSTWPKFAPFTQRNGNLLFFTFNTKIDYGFLLDNGSKPPPEKLPQLWFAAIDLERLDEGDPSTSPVWLPFQETGQRNHLGFWTERVSCGGGSSTPGFTCGTSEVCVEGGCRLDFVR